DFFFGVPSLAHTTLRIAVSNNTVAATRLFRSQQPAGRSGPVRGPKVPMRAGEPWFLVHEHAKMEGDRHDAGVDPEAARAEEHRPSIPGSATNAKGARQNSITAER